MNTSIDIPCFNIKIVLKPGAGVIASNLRSSDMLRNDAAIDAIETMIVSHATMGIDVTSPAYVQGIKDAVEAMSHRINVGGSTIFPLIKFYEKTL